MSEMTAANTKDRTTVSRPEATRGLQFTPRVDIHETEKELTLYAEMPGVRPEDVELHYEKGELFLRGTVAPRKGKKMLLEEYEYGDFFRTFTVHETIDASKITAECKNGLLVVHLPKAEAARPRRIDVRGG